jgi:hypothetical protein
VNIPDVVKEWAKSIGAFVFGVGANLVTNLVNGTTPWPQTGAQWTQLLVTSFGAAIGAWLLPAKISDKQVEKDPTVVRVPAPVVPDGDSPWQP